MTEAILAAARAHWSLGDAPVTLVAARENQVYRVERATCPAALRLHRAGYRSMAEMRSELHWMAMMARAGLTVPAPIPAGDGSEMLETHGVAVDMLTWLEGVPLASTPPTELLYYDLGRLMAQMHALADAWQPPAGFLRPIWDLAGEAPTWGRFWKAPTLKPDQTTLFSRFREAAVRSLSAYRSADTGLIHADLVPENVLVHNATLSPIDFDDGGYGHRLFDIATVTFRSRRSDPSGALAQATCAGYSSIRSLNRAALPLFEALRACSYIGWNATRLHEDGAAARNVRFIAQAEQNVRGYLEA